MMLFHLLDHDLFLLVFAALVLEPNADHTRREASHFNELFLHKGIGSWIGCVAGPEHMELLLIKYSSHLTRGKEDRCYGK